MRTKNPRAFLIASAGQRGNEDAEAGVGTPTCYKITLFKQSRLRIVQ